jgi:hypothetical protein
LKFTKISQFRECVEVGVVDPDSFNPDPDPAEQVNPDPDQGFDDKKL